MSFIILKNEITNLNDLLDLVPVSSWIVKSRASSEFPPAVFVMRHSSSPLPGIKAQQLTLPLHGPPPCFSRPPSPSLAICWCPPQSNSLIVVTIKSEHVPDVLPPPRSDLSAHLLHTCYSSHFLITHQAYKSTETTLAWKILIFFGDARQRHAWEQCMQS